MNVITLPTPPPPPAVDPELALALARAVDQLDMLLVFVRDEQVRARTKQIIAAGAAALRGSTALDRRLISERIELLIDTLDAMDGDPDAEDDDPDQCEAYDDIGTSAEETARFTFAGGRYPGDPEDAEDDDPGEDIGEAEDDGAHLRRRYADERRPLCTRVIRKPGAITYRTLDSAAMFRRPFQRSAGSRKVTPASATP